MLKEIGVRAFTFFEKGVVGHVGFADPFDAKIAAVVKSCRHALVGKDIVLHEEATIICMVSLLLSHPISFY